MSLLRELHIVIIQAFVARDKAQTSTCYGGRSYYPSSSPDNIYFWEETTAAPGGGATNYGGISPTRIVSLNSVSS